MLKINLFGTGQATYNDLPMVDFPNQQPSLLLCFLLLNKQYPHHREHLSALFWGDSPTSIARKRLRNTLWRLGKMFHSVDADMDDYLQVADETISFFNNSDYWLDVEKFLEGIEGCKDISGRNLNPDQALHLEMAVDLYRGDLLESIYEDWLLYDREKYRLQYLNSLNKLMVFHGLNGNYERGLSYGDQILARENTRENVHRQMMWLYAQAGNREAALDQYRRCRQILEDEFGVAPLEKTQSFFQALQKNQFDPRQWPVIPVSRMRTGDMADNSLQPLVRRTLQKLHKLQETIEGTSAELQALERMINQAINRANQNQTETPD
jgi:DNA-binding SARP family transcriptional activator